MTTEPNTPKFHNVEIEAPKRTDYYFLTFYKRRSDGEIDQRIKRPPTRIALFVSDVPRPYFLVDGDSISGTYIPLIFALERNETGVIFWSEIEYPHQTACEWTRLIAEMKNHESK